MPLPRLSRSTAACFLVFALISALVVTGITTDLDLHLLEVIASLRGPAATAVMRAVSWVGEWRCEVSLILMVAGWLWWRGRRRIAWRYTVVAVSGELLYVLVKLACHRARPTIVPRLVRAGWYSYPSGHAMLAPVIWGFGLVLLAQLVTSRAVRAVLWTLAIIIPCLIAISRVYLGVHFPTDVLAGLALGTGWVLLWRRWTAGPSGAVRAD